MLENRTLAIENTEIEGVFLHQKEKMETYLFPENLHKNATVFN